MSKLTLSFKGMTLKTIPLTSGEMVIGSDPACAIHIDSLAVHARHATVATHGGVSSLRDLGSPEGTFVNEERVSGARELKNGDTIRVGKHSLEFIQEPMVEAAPVLEPEIDFGKFAANAKPKSAWLQIMSGHNLGKTLSLNRALTNLGTPGIQTAVIAKRNEGYFLSHLEGEFTPKVGETPIGDKTWLLKDGDIIQIGNVKMQFYFQ